MSLVLVRELSGREWPVESSEPPYLWGLYTQYSNPVGLQGGSYHISHRRRYDAVLASESLDR